MLLNLIKNRFRQCLATRKTKVTCFHDRLFQKANRMVACYKEALERLRLRKIAFVRNIFTCLYGESLDLITNRANSKI